MPHLVLLGDSIFDNIAYTSGGPDVITQVRQVLPSWQATLLARDGAVTDEVGGQISRLPADATHLVLSVGGNDALQEIGVLELQVSSSAEALLALADVIEGFEANYHAALAHCLATRLPLALCTIYNGCFPDPLYQRVISLTLRMFNDSIIRAGLEHGLPVIDLRRICSAPADYANPIEPSSLGGAKMARAIAGVVTATSRTLHGAWLVAE